VLGVLLLVLGTAAEPGDKFEKQFARSEARLARRFATLALRAEKEKQAATARRIFQRVLLLDSENRIARGKLKFKKKAGAWARAPEDAGALDRSVDTDPERAAKIRRELREIEELRAQETVKIALKAGLPDAARSALLAVLEFAPRIEAVHQALGHEEINGRYVRPELVAFARTLPERTAAWDACRKPAEATDTSRTMAFPGMSEAKLIARVGKRDVSSGFTRDATLLLAGRTECSHRLTRLLFGNSVVSWDPTPLYFLTPQQYRDFIHSRHTSEDERKGKTRFAAYRAKDCVAIRASSIATAIDTYSHNVGFLTVIRIAAPLKEDGKPDRARNSWLNEGFGLFLSLELFDTADCWFTSRAESTGKAQPTLPLPEIRTRKSCLAYVRGQLYDGALPPLREIWGNSLNNLDRVRAIQAWTFVRFLALYDPAAFARLAPALKEQTKGAQVDRTMRALEKAFGKKAAELERLWRAYLLELA